MMSQILQMEPETVHNHARLYIGEGEERTPYMVIGENPSEGHPKILTKILNEHDIPFNTDDHQPGASPGTMPYFNGQGYSIVSLGRCKLTDEGLEIYEFYKGNGNEESSIKNLDELRDSMVGIELIVRKKREF